MLSFSQFISLLALAVGLLTSAPKVFAMENRLINPTDRIFEQGPQEFFEFIDQANSSIRTLQTTIKNFIDISSGIIQKLSPHFSTSNIKDLSNRNEDIFQTMRAATRSFIVENNTYDLTASISICSTLLISNTIAYLNALKILKQQAQELKSELLESATALNLQ